MRELYNEFFHIPKEGKIREKVMLVRVATSVVVMVLCLAGMSYAAFASFSSDVTSGMSVIKSANFEASVSIHITGSDEDEVDVTKTDGKTYSAELQAGETYSVTLEKSERSTAATGFCVVTADGCPDIYHTQQIGVDTTAPGGVTERIVFDLTVTKDTTVHFLSHWGTSSYYVAYRDKGEGNRLYITEANTGDKAIQMSVQSTAPLEDEQPSASTTTTTIEHTTVTAQPEQTTTVTGTTTGSASGTSSTTTPSAVTAAGSAPEAEATTTATSTASDTATTPGTTVSGSEERATSTDSGTNGTGVDTTATPTTDETESVGAEAY